MEHLIEDPPIGGFTPALRLLPASAISAAADEARRRFGFSDGRVQALRAELTRRSQLAVRDPGQRAEVSSA